MRIIVVEVYVSKKSVSYCVTREDGEQEIYTYKNVPVSVLDLINCRKCHCIKTKRNNFIDCYTYTF